MVKWLEAPFFGIYTNHIDLSMPYWVAIADGRTVPLANLVVMFQAIAALPKSINCRFQSSRMQRTSGYFTHYFV
jgi:hypothetical protein